MLTVGSLFSGIGGLDLGLERAGMEVIWQSEIDPYACKVLSKHWPEVVNHGNIKEINWGDVVRPDIICGGYPCQPFSTAGKRNGTDDPRHLWPWVREAISELRPKYAILENVRGHVSLGLNVVLGEMASIGYDAEWQIVSAASVGAPHRRDRVIIIAYPIGELANTDNSRRLHRQPQVFTADRWLNALSLIGSGSADVADTNSSDTPNGRKRKGLSSQDTSRGDDRSGSGSGSDIGQVSMGSTRQNTSNVANPDNTGSGAPTSGTDRNRAQEVQRRDNQPQSGLSGCSTDVANTTSKFCNECRNENVVEQPTNCNICQWWKETDIQEAGRASRNFNVANTDARETSRRLGSVPTDTEQVRQQRDNARREESHAGRQWWTTEPDVGRVAHGIPSRVDRLRGLGNAVVPQVAELIGRMVIDYDTNL